MWNVFTQVAGNVFMSFENIVLLVVFLGGIVFYSRDFRIGAILHFVAYALCFVWFYSQGLLYQGAVILTFIFLVILAFSFYAIDSQAARGGLV